MKNLFLCIGLLLMSLTVAADGLDGEKNVFLGNAAGQRIAIGVVTFSPVAEGRWRFEFILDKNLFGEYFLAMAPFRCMQTPHRSLCHFPYGKRDEVTASDWSALEYQLLFLHKQSAALSLDSRNGMLWKLHRNSNRLEGKLYDADLDPIVVPSGNRNNPLTEEFLQPADMGSHPLPELIIE